MVILHFITHVDIYGHVDIVRILVNHKANVNAKTDSGDTPLNTSC